MTRSRNSIAWWMLAVAVVAVGLVPLGNPTDAWLMVLMYVKLSIMVTATFLARFGNAESSPWWFGFSAMGWANLIISVPGLWWPRNPVKFGSSIDYADLVGTLGNLLAEWKSPGAGGGEYLTAVLRFWLMIGCAVAGGLVANTIARRTMASFDHHVEAVIKN